MPVLASQVRQITEDPGRRRALSNPGVPRIGEGRSLRPAFEGGRIQRADAIYWEHEGNRAVCDGRWKLVSRFPDRWELYDLEADRSELNNLAAREPSRVERMVAQYERWAARCYVEPWDKVQKAPRTPAPIPADG